MDRIYSTNGEEEECIYDIAGKVRRKKLLGRLRRRREDNIRMELRETGWDGMNLINRAQDRDR
jgi:hypothetical protein